LFVREIEFDGPALKCDPLVKASDREFRAALVAAKTLHLRGAFDEAEEAYRALAARHVGNIELIHLRGALALQLDRICEALPLLRRAAEAAPSNFQYRSNYGVALREAGQIGDALSELEAALALKPDSADVCTNLGNLYRDLGDFAQARSHLSRAVKFAPLNAACESNYLFGLLFDETIEPTVVAAAHREWGSRLAKTASHVDSRVSRDRSAKALRVGFVSSDLREHAVAFFLEPLLEGLAQESIQSIAYSDDTRSDAHTSRLRPWFTEWRNTAGVGDGEVARRVALDGIDVLVDLGGHTSRNRTPIFARRPAPVQISYLGYPHHPGLDAIQYRIGDPWSDPGSGPATDGPVWRLSRCAWCFKPPLDVSVQGSHTRSDGHSVTYGSFNQVSKISPQTVALWSQVLHAVPASRLVLKAKALRDSLVRYELMARFLAHQIDLRRIQVLDWAPDWKTHMQTYQSVDVALDPFPYHGTTTTCEALWMGVPVITRIGTTHASRVGLSLLHACGFDDWAANSDREYVARAQRLADQISMIRAAKEERRSRFAQSTLMNGRSLASAFALALRAIWEHVHANQAND
jgi:predicted O-linked N-acetylglucosamine transferase (SPINDLY family)